jgi:hypothetical protein
VRGVFIILLLLFRSPPCTPIPDLQKSAAVLQHGILYHGNRLKSVVVLRHGILVHSSHHRDNVYRLPERRKNKMGWSQSRVTNDCYRHERIDCVMSVISHLDVAYFDRESDSHAAAHGKDDPPPSESVCC